MVGFIFAAVLVILLVAAEFGWRTARQNVIDGLSKTQWFAAKVLLLPLLTALFLALRVLVGGTLALAGTDLSAGATLFGPAQTVGARWDVRHRARLRQPGALRGARDPVLGSGDGRVVRVVRFRRASPGGRSRIVCSRACGRS